MNMRRLLRHGWENLVGLIFAVAGLLCLLLLFWVNYVVAGLRATTTSSAVAPPMLDEAQLSPEQPTELPLIEPSSMPDRLPPDESNLLPTAGIYIINGQSLDATINNIVRREQERIAAEKAAAEAKRRAEEARQRKIREQRRKAAEAKRLAEQKRLEEAKRRAEEKRKAEEAKKRKQAEQKKAEDAKRKAAEEQKAAQAKKRKAEADKRKAAEQKKAQDSKRKADAKQKAAQEARRKAKEARELEAKLAALGASAPSLEGGLQSIGSAYNQSDIDGYSTLLDHAVSRYYRLPDNIPSNLEAEFLIKINGSGQVVDVILKKSSGYPLFDREARNAIFAASPLPLPVNPALREDTIDQGIVFKFKP